MQEPTSLLEFKQLTEYGFIQCDQHNRDKNERRAQEMHDAHVHLILRFAPFIYSEDEKLEPIDLMQVVADRLIKAIAQERQRRIDVCPPGFEYLLRA